MMPFLTLFSNLHGTLHFRFLLQKIKIYVKLPNPNKIVITVLKVLVFMFFIVAEI